MPKRNQKKGDSTPGVSEQILGKLGRIIPGFDGFFRKAEASKTFGPKMAEIRKEIDRRFGKKSGS